MKKYQQIVLCLAVLLTAIVGYGFLSNSIQKKPAADPAFVLVELFTSEGCSSCPAAEMLVGSIAAENNRNIYILAFHVDYWDQLGWKDKFSNSVYTDRQKEWAEVFKLKSIYTPQIV